jgi:hypothetical protein
VFTLVDKNFGDIKTSNKEMQFGVLEHRYFLCIS